MIYKAYRYRLLPTEAQKRVLSQHFGAVRFVYNWALETKKRAWEESEERLTLYDLQNQLPGLKKEKEWLSLPFAQSLQIAVRHLDFAFESFFRGNGYPKFKAKSNRQSVAYYQEAKKPSMVNFDTETIRIPKIGPVKCVISQRYDGKLKTLTVTKTPTGKYFALCIVEVDLTPPVAPNPVESDAIGVDLGINDFATLSTGEKIANPRHMNKSLKRLRRAHRRVDKKKKGSKNREKSRKKLATLHEKVANQRQDFLHKTSTKLIRENQTICIEDLNVAGMVRLHNLARHIQDAGWGEFRHQLTYKAKWYGKNVLVINRFAPSSRQCSCGHKNETLKLQQRTWVCVQCGVTHDRDILAANNIIKFAFHPELAVKKFIGRGTPECTPVETLALAGH